MHHTLPDQPDIYTHRSGRTARAGKKGISLAFINPREGKRISELERRMKVKFERIEVPAVEEMRYSRINSWANLIINTHVDDKAEEVLQHLHGQFAHLSKEDILRRLITTQLDHLIFQHNDEDLNEKSDAGARNGKKDPASNRYFVNIGIIDGMTKGDLIHFLSDVSKVDRKHFGEISMHKNYSFFQISSAVDKKISDSFMGVEIEGRQIRVNLDENKRSGRDSSGGKGRMSGKRSWNSKSFKRNIKRR
jgi:ATP-dependent RNA helicase DeaD